MKKTHALPFWGSQTGRKGSSFLNKYLLSTYYVSGTVGSPLYLGDLSKSLTLSLFPHR